MSFFAAALALQLKRLLWRPATAVCLLALPALVLAVGLFLPRAAHTPVLVGVLLPKNSRQGAVIWQSLESASHQNIQFLASADEGQLKALVAAGRWECGYLLPENLDKRLETGQLARLVTRVDSPATSLGGVLDWSVAAAILNSYAPTLANKSLAAAGVLPKEGAALYESLAAKLFAPQALLKMDVVPVNTTSVPTVGGALLTAASLVRGVVALLLLVFSCLCAVWFADDRQTGFFQRLRPYSSTVRLYLPTLAAATVLHVAAGLLSLGLAVAFFPAYFGDFLGEAALLLLYMLPLGAFSFLLAMLFSNRELLVCLLPFLLVACLLLCPVLVDLSAYVPALAVPSALLPPTAYLRAAAGMAPFWHMPLAAAAFLALGLLVGKGRKKL